MIRMNSHKTVLMPKSLEDNQVQMDNICKAFNTGSASDAAASIGELFRCRGMSQVSMASGIGRAVLYRSFGKSGNPTLQVLLDSLRAVGLTLVVAEAKEREKRPGPNNQEPSERKLPAALFLCVSRFLHDLWRDFAV